MRFLEVLWESALHALDGVVFQLNFIRTEVANCIQIFCNIILTSAILRLSSRNRQQDFQSVFEPSQCDSDVASEIIIINCFVTEDNFNLLEENYNWLYKMYQLVDKLFLPHVKVSSDQDRNNDQIREACEHEYDDRGEIWNRLIFKDKVHVRMN